MLKKVLVLIIIAIILWLSSPIYQFYAHRGKAPLPPTGWLTIPVESPTTQVVYNPHFLQAGKDALAVINQHRQTINAPAISAAIAINGEIIWAGAAGWADVDGKKVATENTLFRIGSTSKALTATALARLVDAGTIDLDMPISEYLGATANPSWQPITPRQLASHTAGLVHYKENQDWFGLYRTIALNGRYENVEDALSVFDDTSLLFESGTDFSYSTFGTVLLSATMQAAAKTPYLSIMQQQVFTPLKMSATFAEYELIDNNELARFYWNDQGRSSEVREWREVDLSHRLAGGGFTSTSSDLVKLASAYMDENFMSKTTRETFWTPQQLKNGELNKQHYGLGWRIHDYQDPRKGIIVQINHGGVSRGAQCWLMIIPDYQLAMAVNINANTNEFWDFAKVSMQIADLFINEVN